MAFDTVNQEFLWAVLGKVGCPRRFVGALHSFHDKLQATEDVPVVRVLSSCCGRQAGLRAGVDLVQCSCYSGAHNIQ